MAKSIRISDDLYGLAVVEARLMHRSLAQQIEHWAALGQAVEASSVAEAHRLSIENMHAIDRQRVREGALSAEDLVAIPARVARRARLVFPKR